MATIPLSMLIAASSPYGRSAPCGTPIVAITAETIHQSSSGVRRRAASARTLAPIGSGRPPAGTLRPGRQFVASEYKGCSEIGGVNSASAWPRSLLGDNVVWLLRCGCGLKSLPVMGKAKAT
jgi:hypothetical protein